MEYHIKNPGPKISDAEIRALEQELGMQLPKDYREFLLQTNGGESGDLEFQRESGQIDSIGVFHGLRGKSESGDILWVRMLLEDRIGAGRFLPIADTPCGDMVILDMQTGGMFLWTHDAEAEVEILAGNFADFWRSLKEPIPDPPECDFETWAHYSPDWRGKYGHSVVEAAAIAGRVDIVKAGGEAGLPIGESMRYAAMNGNMDVVDLLVSMGVNINQVDNKGRTPLDWARWKNDFASALRVRGAKTGEELRTGHAS